MPNLIKKKGASANPFIVKLSVALLLTSMWTSLSLGMLHASTSLQQTARTQILTPPMPSQSTDLLIPIINSTNYLFDTSHYYRYTAYPDSGIILAGNTHTPGILPLLVMVDKIDINQIKWNISRANYGYSHDLALSKNQKSVYWLVSNLTGSTYYPLLVKVSVENGSIEWLNEFDSPLIDEITFPPRLWVTENPSGEVLISFNSPNPTNNTFAMSKIYCINASGSVVYNYSISDDSKHLYSTDIIYDPLTKNTAISLFIVEESGESYSKIVFYSDQNKNHEILWKADRSRGDDFVDYWIRGLILILEPNEINKLLPVNSFRSQLFAVMTNRIQGEIVYNIFIASIPLYEQHFLSILDLNKISPTKIFTGQFFWMDFKSHLTKSTHYLAFDFNSIFVMVQTSMFNLTLIQTSCNSFQAVKNYTYNAQRPGFDRIMYPNLHFDSDNRLIILAGLKRANENYWNSMISIFKPIYYDPYASLEPTPLYIWLVLPLLFVPILLLKKPKKITS